MKNNRRKLRNKLLASGDLQLKCYTCGITEWMGQPAPLELDHIDGNRDNNAPNNIRLLCVNCHMQTPTWGNRNRKLRKLKNLT